MYCAWDGTWWAGRYVGTISLEGRTLVILPRFGLSTLRSWLSHATSVVLTESPGRLREDESFIAQLLAAFWAHGFIEAARHGLPALRRDVANKGMTIRGRLDVPSSVRLIASGRKQLISIRADRSLDHAATEAIVAAYSVLRRWLPDEKWMPQRAKELIPHLLAVAGRRPRVPTKMELDRIRYTPITAGFAPVAELSRHIAIRRGLSADIEANSETRGVLLDVAELWELYFLSVLRTAVAPLKVKHGTREKDSSKKLLRSDVTGEGLGTLIPDAIVYYREEVSWIADAKYKSIYPSTHAPNGPQREDLYQMAAYLGRFGSGSALPVRGLLAYPEDPDRPGVAPAEHQSPWSLDGGRKVTFVALAHDVDAAKMKLRTLMPINSVAAVPGKALKPIEGESFQHFS